MTESNTPESGNEGRVDRLGAVASTACAIHCALCAFIPATFAALGLDFLLGHEAEWALTLIAVGLGVGALVMGWRSHGQSLAMVTLGIGITALLAARLLEGGHHDDHHGDSAHATTEQESHKKTAGNADDHDSGDEHEGESHLVAEVIGIGGGLVLMAGHLFNLGAMRSRREELTPDECNTDC